MDRPLSIAERKLQLGIQDGTERTAGLNFHEVHTSRSVSPPAVKPKPTRVLPNPSQPSSPLPPKKKRKISNKPTVAPKSDLVMNLPPAQPRRKRPPPPRPVPYAHHKDAKVKEITTFKSTVPLSPRPLPSEPPPQRPPRRFSTKGEPSPRFYQPSTAKEPIHYAIPEIPRSTEKSGGQSTASRPRLDTPHQPPGATPTVLNGLPSQVVETTRSHDPGDQSSGLKSVPEVCQAEVLYAEAYEDVPKAKEKTFKQDEYCEVGQISAKILPVVTRPKSPSPSSPPPVPSTNSEYDVTVHRGISPRPQHHVSPVPSPQPAEDEYSVLDRPEKRDLTPSPAPQASDGYSELNIEDPVWQVASQQGGYGHLDFGEGDREGEVAQLVGVEGYDVLCPESQWRNVTAKPPSPVPPVPIPKPRNSPRTKARKASVKAKRSKMGSSRDRSVLPTYNKDGSPSTQANSVPSPRPRKRHQYEDPDEPQPLTAATKVGSVAGTGTDSVPSPRPRRRHQYEEIDEPESLTAETDSVPSPRPRRRHQYEEIDEPESLTAETDSVPSPRPRRRHQYEEIDEPESLTAETETSGFSSPSHRRQQDQHADFDQPESVLVAQPRYETVESFSPPPEEGVGPVGGVTGGSVEEQEPTSSQVTPVAKVVVDIDYLRSHSQIGRRSSEDRVDEEEGEGEAYGGEELYAEIPTERGTVWNRGSGAVYINQGVVDSFNVGVNDQSNDPGPPPVMLKYADEYWTPESDTPAQADKEGEGEKEEDGEGATYEGPTLKPSSFHIVQHPSRNFDPEGYCEVDLDTAHLCPVPEAEKTSKEGGTQEDASQRGDEDSKEVAVCEKTPPPSLDPGGYCEIDVKHVYPKQKDRGMEKARQEEGIRQNGSQNGGECSEELAVRETVSSAVPGRITPVMYVATETIHAKKEESRHAGKDDLRENGKGTGGRERGKEEGRKDERKPKKPATRPSRPPPPPPISISTVPQPPSPPTSATSPSSGSTPRAYRPKDSPRQHGVVSPKAKERGGIFSRVKSRSVHGAKPKSPRERELLEKSMERSAKVETSPSFSKRIKGIFKSNNASVSQRKPTALSPGAAEGRKTMTLPGRTPRQESPEDVGIYSIIHDPPGHWTKEEKEDDIHVELDSDAYAIIGDDLKARLSKGRWKEKKRGGTGLRKASSVENLYDGDEHLTSDFRERAGSRSASSSPQLPRRRGNHPLPPLPPVDPSYPHHATLPRSKRGGPPINLSQFYTPSTNPPKTAPQHEQSVVDNGDEQSVETFEVKIGSSDSSPTGSDTPNLVSSSLGGESHRLSAADPPWSEEEGLDTSEIPHTVSEEGSLYAVVHPKAKPKKKAMESPDLGEEEDVGGGSQEARGGAGEEVQTPPAKPKRLNKAAPPKPPPYYRDSYTGPVPPQQSPLSARRRPPELTSSLPLLKPMVGKSKLLEGMASPVVGGPPPFSPPPPPSEAEDIGGEHTYEIPAEVLENARASKDKDKPVLLVEQKTTDQQTESIPLGNELAAAPEEMVLVSEVPSTPPIQRASHVYAVLPEGMGDVPRSLAVPMRQHIYEAPPELGGKKEKSRKRTTQFPQLPKKSKPPPAPPVGKPKTGQTSLTPKISPIGKPVSGEPASLPLEPTYLGVRIPHVEEGEGGEPKFLFPSHHSQTFLMIGHDGPEAVPSPSVSSSTLSIFDDESEGEFEDSTDWETSSGGEEEEGEKELRPPSPVRPKIYYIAREILTTERTFVKGLALLDRDFRQMVLSSIRAHEKLVIPEESLKLILGNVGSLLSLNSGMLTELEERMLHWDHDPRIGDIILDRAPYLKLYTEYISKFDKALKHLDECMKKYSLFAEVVREFEAQPKCAHLPLASYLLEIVQRIPRYKMLLSDYLKHLPDDSEDKVPSRKALEIISAVATHVNETIRLMDNFRKVVEVRKKLIGDTGDSLITPYRKLLKEGELIKSSRKEKQLRMFFLFNDILIYASSIPPANTTFKVVKRIPLDGMKVELLDDPEMRCGFQIISTCKSFRLEASCMEERKQWLEAFEAAIKETSDRIQSRAKARMSYHVENDGNEPDMAPLGQLAPAWLPDSAVSMCQLCSVQFMFTRRRHHCRACGMIFCTDCSCYLAPLKYKGNKLGRVCQSCHGKLSEGEERDDSKQLPKKRSRANRRSQKLVNMPSVLREVKARDQNAQVSGYLMSHTSKSKKWKRKWFVVYNLVMYEFERHEDVSAKRSITLPSYEVINPAPDDPLVFCLKHAGIGNHFFKVEYEKQLKRWLDVLQRAVRGETGDEPQSSIPRTSSPQRPDSSTGRSTDSDA